MADIRPRSVPIGGRRTSVRLESAMWDALADIAEERGKTIHDLIAEIDRARRTNLTSAIRVYIVEHYRAAIRRLGETAT